MQTDSAYVYTFLRLVAGVIVLPYGMQKLFGWPGSPEFGPKGINGTLEQITAKHIPLDQRREKGSSILYCFLQSCCSLSLRAVVRYQSIVG